jgi:molybdate/tungstate transport system ATP-binding protein
MIRIHNLHITVGRFRLEHIDLRIREKEFFVLMGPTGAGKTVLLEAIAGLIPTDRGKVLIQGKEITGLPPEKRGVGIVYQDHALFPHLSVKKNVTYGLRFHREARA